MYDLAVQINSAYEALARREQSWDLVQDSPRKVRAMAAPRNTLWPADPHTLAKHAILRQYLHAWFPILTSANGRVVYYDGFAGPGRYSNGEDGSPLIALKAAADHATKLKAEIVFVFVEKDADRAKHLREVEIPSLSLPDNFKWEVKNEEFEPALRGLLDELGRLGQSLAPTFAFVDPFGVSGVPFDLIKRLLRNESCEVMVTFMKSYIHRFVTELGPHVDTLIGNPLAASTIAGAPDRAQAARELYAQSLSTAARYVRYFEMRNAAGVPIYDLFFATNHRLGHKRMKESMWKVDGEGTYGFCDGVDPSQATLFSSDPGSALARDLVRAFGEKVTTWTDVQELKTYVMDSTPFIDTHATKALQLLEAGAVDGCDDRLLEVAESKRDGKKRRRGSFPEGTLVRFVARR